MCTISFIQKSPEILITASYSDCAQSVIFPILKKKKKITFCGPIIFSDPLI